MSSAAHLPYLLRAVRQKQLRGTLIVYSVAIHALGLVTLALNARGSVAYAIGDIVGLCLGGLYWRTIVLPRSKALLAGPASGRRYVKHVFRLYSIPLGVITIVCVVALGPLQGIVTAGCAFMFFFLAPVIVETWAVVLSLLFRDG
jgi:hypothetical protein